MAHYLKSEKIKGETRASEYKDCLMIFDYYRPSIFTSTFEESGSKTKSTSVALTTNISFSCLIGSGLISLLEILVDSETLKRVIITTTGSIDNTGKGVMKEKPISIDTYQDVVVTMVVCGFDEDGVRFDTQHAMSQNFAYVQLGYSQNKLEDIRYDKDHSKKSADSVVISPTSSSAKR